jgi:hypothetical protein
MAHNPHHLAEEPEESKSRSSRRPQLLLMVQDRVNQAFHALVKRDRALFEAVNDGYSEVQALHLEIDDRCSKMLALQQPDAIDLRVIAGAVKIKSDLERIGDLAVHIALTAKRYLAHRSATRWAHNPERALVQKSSGAILVRLGFLGARNGTAIWLRRRFEKRW